MDPQANPRPLDAGALQAIAHWKEFRPKLYHELLKSNRLELAAQEASDLTADAVSALQKKGLSHQEAWESVRENWLFLPSEEDLPELGVDPANFPDQEKPATITA